MSYTKQIVEIAQQIEREARALGSLEEDRAEWTKPDGRRYSIGEWRYPVVRKDGTVTPGLEGVQREALAVLDGMISAQRSKIEGLRFKLVQLAKNGGAA